jgi:hypothetical protein
MIYSALKIVFLLFIIIIVVNIIIITIVVIFVDHRFTNKRNVSVNYGYTPDR